MKIRPKPQSEIDRAERAEKYEKERLRKENLRIRKLEEISEVTGLKLPEIEEILKEIANKKWEIHHIEEDEYEDNNDSIAGRTRGWYFISRESSQKIERIQKEIECLQERLGYKKS